MSIITLTTDYGLKDYFVGALKGKLLSNNPDVTIVDISHDIDPFNTVEASYVISAACFSFPKGTVHLIGVDLELTKENKHIVMKCHDSYFIAADNGILSMLSQKIFQHTRPNARRGYRYRCFCKSSPAPSPRR
jgi:S-adenosylmethionine hydrolase